jgi:hypothetical protein
LFDELMKERYHKARLYECQNQKETQNER